MGTITHLFVPPSQESYDDIVMILRSFLIALSLRIEKRNFEPSSGRHDALSLRRSSTFRGEPMTLRTYCFTLASVSIGAMFYLGACGASTDERIGGPGGPGNGPGGSSSTGAGGGSSGGSSTGGSSATGGSPGVAGTTTGTGGASTGTGGATPGTGGSNTGGSAGTGGRAPRDAGGAPPPVDAGGGGTPPPGNPPPPLDCGPIGTVLNNAGPPSNRVNYVVLADGYTSTTVNTTLMTHMNNAMTERFTPELGQPYLRYKNFVNICLFKTVSQTDGIGNGSTIFSCTGSDSTRLATCQTNVAQQQ